MKLQPAAEMKKVTISNFDKLKADALQSDDFKNLVKGIENQAEKGLCEYTYRCYIPTDIKREWLYN